MQANKLSAPKINREHTSPNFEQVQIPVEFVVIHYTACSLSKTLEIFCDTARQVSSHLVINYDGEIFELIPCLGEACYKTWHSGKSKYTSQETKEFEAFNNFSIGIELVNFNGNIFPFSEEQYASLAYVIQLLSTKYPALKTPDRIVGHEQIAGFRGKSDPGACFDWSKLYTTLESAKDRPQRQQRLNESSLELIKTLAKYAPTEEAARDEFFMSLSSLVEKISVA